VSQPVVPPQVPVEPARPEDHPAIGELTVRVYRDGGLAPAAYLPTLGDVDRRASLAELLVARHQGRVVGSVALVLDGEFGEVLEPPHEAGFRMLVVDPACRGLGIGAALVHACLDRARAAGKRRMVLSTDPPHDRCAPAVRTLGIRPAAGAGLVAVARRRPARLRPRPLRARYPGVTRGRRWR
jgi:ribosomal protein S18 acetylase RimI-like enzyme